MSERGDIIIGEGNIKFGLEYRDLLSDQGVCIHALGNVDGTEVELLRFDCFDHEPHYHYGPAKRNERLMLDQTTEGNPLDWAIVQLRNRLPDMVRRAGYDDLADNIDMGALADDLDQTDALAHKMALEERRTVTHDRGDVIIESGTIRFGIEYRHLNGDEGVAIHVLGDVNGEEHEFLTFDCFQKAPHYHYGPRAKNQRLYLDKAIIPDPLSWALDLFRGGKLASMLDRAGYPSHASGLNPAILSESVTKVSSIATKMEKDNNG